MSEIVVLKLGGTTLVEQRHVLAEVATIARRRPVVIVHLWRLAGSTARPHQRPERGPYQSDEACHEHRRVKARHEGCVASLSDGCSDVG